MNNKEKENKVKDFEKRLSQLPDDLGNTTNFFVVLHMMLLQLGGEFRIPVRRIVETLESEKQIQFIFMIDPKTNEAVLTLHEVDDGR